jgi:HlyD family secretion protein
MSDLKTELAGLRIDPEQRHGSGQRGAWLAGVLLLLAVAGGLGWWWFGARPVVVEAATAEAQQAGAPRAAVLNASGYVTARRRATVSSKITGKVVEVNVEEGMRVREGQVLARLDDSTLRASLALAEAQLAAARSTVEESEVRLKEARLTLDRRRQLRQEGVVGQADVDAAEAEVDSLRARITAAQRQAEVAASQVALQRTQLDDTIIRAPFSGVAITKDAQPGEMVSPVSAGGGFTRTGICTIVDMSSLEIEVDVSESYINRVTARQQATAVLDAYPDWQIPARVITTIPAADRQKATVLVRLGFEALDPRILPDMGVKVAFHDVERATAELQPAAATLVPKSALRSADGSSVIFVIDGGDRVERRAVRLGAEQGERVEIVSGIAAGERVVVSPPAALADGDKVRISASGNR